MNSALGMGAVAKEQNVTENKDVAGPTPSEQEIDEKPIVFDDKNGDAFVTSLEQVIKTHKIDENGIDRISKVIIDQGINVTILDCFVSKPRSTRRPLHVAVDKKALLLVKIILAAGAKHDIDEKDSAGMTALWLAVDQGHEDIALLLIDNAASTIQLDANKCNILHLAAARGLYKVVHKVCYELDKFEPGKIKLAKLLAQKNKAKVTPLDCANNRENQAKYLDGNFARTVTTLKEFMVPKS